MNIVFYIAAAVAVLATALAVTRLNVVHGLLYLIVSLLAVAVVFFTLGAPFIAALEVIIYAGAIMVLFVFVVMMLNLGPRTIEQEHRWLSAGIWTGPSILAAVLLAELFYVFLSDRAALAPSGQTQPQAVGALLFGPYLLAVELSSILLMAGLVGAYHLGRRDRTAAHSTD
ncbi:MAG: NADH-quinone oxidoreductase subunit J [Acidobacteriia bacterium]|nr:NADH-quinone oxidoreductase subunit J [Terriglobia bacterium]